MSGIDIVKAMDIMCRNQKQISAVERQAVDFFSFMYLGKQVWAVAKPIPQEVWVRFYPGINQFDEKADFIEYRKSEFVEDASEYDKHDTNRAFERLFEAVRDTHYHVGDAMEEILKSDRPSAS